MKLKLRLEKAPLEKFISVSNNRHNIIALNVQTNERFALKIENKRCNNLLEEESHILLYLKGEEGIPQILSYGYSGQSNVLVMELLGPSLNSLLEKNNGTFSLKTVCLLGDQIVYIYILIEYS